MSSQTDTPLPAAGNEYYIHRPTASPVALHSKVGDTITLINTQTLTFHKFTTKEFNRLVDRNKLQKAQFLLSYTFIGSASNREVNGSLLSCNPQELTDKLSNIVASASTKNTSQGNRLIFNNCSIQDLFSGQTIMNARSIQEVKQHVEQFNAQQSLEPQKTFKPSPINIKEILANNSTQQAATNTAVTKKPTR